MLRYIGVIVVALVALTGCGGDDPSSTVTPSTTRATSPAEPSAPASSVPAQESTQQERSTPDPVQVVPTVPPGESVELQIPPLVEQPAPGTAGNSPVSPEDFGTITCETVCTSTGCEQYQYSVLGCP